MRKRGLVLATAVMSLLPVLPTAVYAQDGFLFGPPKAQLTLRAGPVLHRAGGDVFDFFRSELTLDRGDFRAPSIGGDVSIVLHRRLDLALGASYSSVSSGSEFREWIGEDDQPIEQVTQLSVIPVTASVRFYPLERGHAISDLAWIPARTTPYLGGGVGAAFYRLKQHGEFVEESDLSIFRGDFESRGRALTGHVLGGLDHWLTPKLGMNLEGRYTFGSARPSGDFSDWDRIDLSGLQFGLGLVLRW